MSEHKAIYDVTGLDCSIEEFKMRPCVRHRYSPEFVQPTPDEIKFVRTALLGWPQTKLGAWRRILLAAGVIEGGEDLQIADRYLEFIG